MSVSRATPNEVETREAPETRPKYYATKAGDNEYEIIMREDDGNRVCVDVARSPNAASKKVAMWLKREAKAVRRYEQREAGK